MRSKALFILGSVFVFAVVMLTAAVTFGLFGARDASKSVFRSMADAIRAEPGLTFGASLGGTGLPAQGMPVSGEVAPFKDGEALVVLAPQRRTISEEMRYAESAKRAFWPVGERPESVNGVPVLYPELVPICACESSYHGTWWDMPRHFENGRVLRNYKGNDDIGMCQINVSIYGATAARLGYDLATVEGNINFSNWLFEREGSAPWYHSETCWRAGVEKLRSEGPRS